MVYRLKIPGVLFTLTTLPQNVSFMEIKEKDTSQLYLKLISREKKTIKIKNLYNTLYLKKCTCESLSGQVILAAKT